MKFLKAIRMMNRFYEEGCIAQLTHAFIIPGRSFILRPAPSEPGYEDSLVLVRNGDESVLFQVHVETVLGDHWVVSAAGEDYP